MGNIKKVILTFVVFLLILTPSISALNIYNIKYEKENDSRIIKKYEEIDNKKIFNPSVSRLLVKQKEAKANADTGQKLKRNKTPFMVLISLLIVLVLIMFTKILIRFDKISNKNEKLFWNILLLIFFLFSGVTGLILVFESNASILEETGLNFTQLHTITSFFFFWISGYHILWHLTYYSRNVRCLFK